MRSTYLLFGIILVVGVAHPAFSDDFETQNECLKCHVDELSQPNIHGIAQADCAHCHSPHGTQTKYPYRLSKKTNDLCLYCHRRISNGHPVMGHPIYLAKDPMNPRQEFTCLSCHNPHSSEMPKLFRFNYNNGAAQGNPCRVCHPY